MLTFVNMKKVMGKEINPFTLAFFYHEKTRIES